MNEFKNEKITWRTKNIYVDVDTGEQIDEIEARNNYIIIRKKKKSNVYKSTGTTTITNECRRSTQGKLF